MSKEVEACPKAIDRVIAAGVTALIEWCESNEPYYETAVRRIYLKMRLASFKSRPRALYLGDSIIDFPPGTTNPVFEAMGMRISVVKPDPVTVDQAAIKAAFLEGWYLGEHLSTAEEDWLASDAFASLSDNAGVR